MCDCVCVLDCVRVFREDGPRFFRGDVFSRGPIFGGNVDVPVFFFFVLLVLCPQTREMRDFESSFPPFAFAAIAPFLWADNSELLYCLRGVCNGIYT